MRSAGKTDVGMIRKVNEDNFKCLEFCLNDDAIGNKSENKRIYVYMVADGMGGHNAGEVASTMAIQEVSEYIKSKHRTFIKDLCSKSDNTYAFIQNAIEYTNDKIYKKSILDSNCIGMGTTLSMAMIIDNELYMGHVGDSRIYLIRNNNISKLTEDHSLVAELVKNGSIKPEEANHHPQKNIITRALGTEFTVDVDKSMCEIRNDDYIVLCSDGLSNLVEDEEIKNIVLENSDIDIACEKLISSAKEKGGFDNITVIIVQISRGGDCSDR